MEMKNNHLKTDCADTQHPHGSQDQLSITIYSYCKANKQAALAKVLQPFRQTGICLSVTLFQMRTMQKHRTIEQGLPAASYFDQFLSL